MTLTSGSNTQLDALLHGVGVAPLDQIGWIRVTGSDRVRWLNGMATNSVQDLAAGTGAYNFFLNAQGRIQADGNIFASSDELLIETGHNQVATLIPYLDHYIIMDDVELADISDTRHGLTLIGPKAASLLAQLGLVIDDFAELAVRTLTWNSATITLIRAHDPLVPRYELWVSTQEEARAVRKALEENGAIPCEAEPLDWLRLLEGTPLYGTDIRDRDLPQETNQARALHFNKGCYLGQEIVERIRSRGNVHRTFMGFRLEGTLPVSGTALESAGKQAGELTSFATIPLAGRNLQRALGYIRREALERHEPIQYAGGTAHPDSSPFSVVEPKSSSQASELQERI
ncbi:CAF17-like 4Fe-4S cluster assembly/insertion protein YgfZ [Edaphobacter albus]|uniref:CAF17-like 4Fe-4S cluster assembly/insertion protein YgfZ n=1 Tax=Edaphobacter sp. 4G125 TaxID=2763071 RepID=UPI0016454EF1|nr:folate-binding protein YgfZ [Edaphobacter sp. 4G125]QNI37595.1 folate-binding protein YgfZ [Edaphobacter sp. 4G125]